MILLDARLSFVPILSAAYVAAHHSLVYSLIVGLAWWVCLLIASCLRWEKLRNNLIDT